VNNCIIPEDREEQGEVLSEDMLEKLRTQLWSQPVIKPSDEWIGWKIYHKGIKEDDEMV
jgi:hypothetical protein